MKRTYDAFDPGNPYRQTDAASARRGAIFKTDDGQLTITDGQGNKVWFADTSSGNVTITLPDARETVMDTQFTVKRVTGGANSLTVTAAYGNIDGAASHSIPTQYAAYTYISDGQNYWIV